MFILNCFLEAAHSMHCWPLWSTYWARQLSFNPQGNLPEYILSLFFVFRIRKYKLRQVLTVESLQLHSLHPLPSSHPAIWPCGCLDGISKTQSWTWSSPAYNPSWPSRVNYRPLNKVLPGVVLLNPPILLIANSQESFKNHLGCHHFHDRHHI